MVFDPFSWATSFFLNNLGKSFLDKHGKDLASELGKTAKAWEAHLPDGMHFNVEGLFTHVQSGEDVTHFPSRGALISSLKESRVPSDDVWFDALFERWSYVRDNVENPHLFFLQSPETAEKSLRGLSNELWKTCSKNKDLFQITVIESLSNVTDRLDNLSLSHNPPSEGDSDLVKGLDNDLIGELAIAGYVNEADGLRRAIYLDKDGLYVPRVKSESVILEKVHSYSTNPESNNHWISIVGDAGQGKSSLVWHIYNSVPKENCNVYCILAQLSQCDLLHRLEQVLVALVSPSIILFDTLDLVVGVNNARLASVINGFRHSGHLIITTCRRQEIRGIPLSCDVEVELNRYSDEEAIQAITNYITRFYPGKSEHEQKAQFENVWNILDAQRRIQELDLDPLILTMIFQTYFPDKIPQDINTQKIYDQFWQVRVLEDRQPSEKERRTRVYVCLLLARCICFSSEAGDSYDLEELATRWHEKRPEDFPYDIVNRLVSSGTLQWARGRAHVRFFHQTFLEYAAAMDIRRAKKADVDALLHELGEDLKEDVPRRAPILKQIAVQEFAENGVLFSRILQLLHEIHTLLSLQLALEILGKVGESSGYADTLCQQWIEEDPSSVATTVREAIKHYPRSKIRIGLKMLEPCLQTHEEISIYVACSEKLSYMDGQSVHLFIQSRLSNVLDAPESDLTDDRRSRIREALVSVFACGVNDALKDLFQLFPRLKSGQRAGLLTNLGRVITDENCRHVLSFCREIFEAVTSAEKGEVRLSFISLLESLQKFLNQDIIDFVRSVYEDGRWRHNPKHATFTGSLVGKFLLDRNTINSLIQNLNSREPHVRLLSAWALQEADKAHHDEIVKEIISLSSLEFTEHATQMVFKIVGNLDQASPQLIFRFLEQSKWPSDVVLPDEFRQTWGLLAGNDEKDLLLWLWDQMESATGIRYRQLFIGLLTLIAKNVHIFDVEELARIYKIACRQEVFTFEFASVAGLIAYKDVAFSKKIFDLLLKSRNQNIRTAAIRSLTSCVNDHLSLTVSLGDTVMAISGKRDHYGLLHCYLETLQTYSGDEGTIIVDALGRWFSKDYLISFDDETAMVRLLTLLKIYGIKYANPVFEIANRCPIFTQGVAGALSAVYANVVVSLDDKGKLTNILEETYTIIKTQTGRGQKRIRNSLRMVFPYLIRKLGAETVFDSFFAKYKEITSPYALEDLVSALVVAPEWSTESTYLLLKDATLPPQVRSIVISRGTAYD